MGCRARPLLPAVTKAPAKISQEGERESDALKHHLRNHPLFRACLVVSSQMHL